ncbi:MAG: hypothetical protein H8E13_12315 [Actinobacteria bacterium]|nr:hypothetical protein [Actinomycetota bacterium]
MNTRTRKNKGKGFQNKIRDLLLENFNSLEPDDIISNPMGSQGEDLFLSPAARKQIPYSFEIKRQERLNIYKSIEQAEKNTKIGCPAVVFKKNYSKS